jgi:hypothetical protein
MPPEHLSDDDDPSPERRWEPRVDLFQEISCEKGGVVVHSGMADLGAGGMFVDTPRTCFPVGSRVLVRFGLRGGEPPVVASAEVRYIQDRLGMGLRFAALILEDRERIRAFVEEAVRRKIQGGPPVRKSARVSVEVPVRVRGTRSDGPPFDERTRIVTLSKYGACLVCGQPLAVGKRLLLEIAAGPFESSIVWVGDETSRSEGQVGVQCRGLAQSLGFQFP